MVQSDLGGGLEDLIKNKVQVALHDVYGTIVSGALTVRL